MINNQPSIAPIGITVNPAIGLGDTVQFSSLPENYFLATGERLIDLSKSWVFDHNPYVIRSPERTPKKTIELWNFGHKNKWQWENPRSDSHRPAVYLSNAEIWASALSVIPKLNRPRLYVHEDFPFERRRKILLHVDGKSHGIMPQHVIDHVLEKYGPLDDLYQIGVAQDINLGIPRIETPSIWDLVKEISECRMLIGMDSGPAWIGACFPDVIVKKLRMTPRPDYFQDWVPLDIKNIHAHWDDRCHQIFNPTDHDIGFTASFRRI